MQDVFERLERHYAALSLAVARPFIVPTSTDIAALHVLHKGSTARGLAKYQDQYFFYDADVLHLDAQRLQQLHAQNRAYVASLFRVPTPLRRTVPHTISIAVSRRGFAEEMIYAVEAQPVHVPEGKAHTVTLVDLGRNMVFTYGGCRVWLGTHRDEAMRALQVVPQTPPPFVRANVAVIEGFNSVWAHNRGGASS
jgi:hypothetical protein